VDDTSNRCQFQHAERTNQKKKYQINILKLVDFLPKNRGKVKTFNINQAKR
jgi:hypothetical protein